MAARAQLGNLLDGPVLETFPGFEEQLLAACARVLALCVVAICRVDACAAPERDQERVDPPLERRSSSQAASG